jgi:hypothetical protein
VRSGAGGESAHGAELYGHVSHTRTDRVRRVTLQRLNGLVECKGLAYTHSVAGVAPSRSECQPRCRTGGRFLRCIRTYSMASPTTSGSSACVIREKAKQALAALNASREGLEPHDDLRRSGGNLFGYSDRAVGTKVRG